jgi:2-oxoisovalerate dehydrogenase E1 component alpha subunit
MNFAGIHQLGVVFICENNHYAISVPQEREVPVPDVASKAAGYGMPGVVVDGNDLFDTYEAVHAAMRRARSGEGPTLVECKTYRLRPHSNADDDSKYRSPQEVEDWRKRDPIIRLQTYVLEQALMTQAEIDALQESVNQAIDEASEAVAQAGSPPLESIFDHLYAPEED